METVGPLIEDIAVLYFVGIDWVVRKVENGRSKSRRGGTLGANILLGREFGCCTELCNFQY